VIEERCARGRQCCGEHDGRGMWTQPPWCDACLSRAGDEVAALVYDYADLERLLPGTTVGRRDTMITESRELPIPYNLHADALQRAIWHSLTTWEEIVRERVRAPGVPTDVRPGYAVQRAAAFLAPRTAILSRLEPVAVYPVGSTSPEPQAGLEGLETLTALHRQARAMLGLTRKVEILFGGCPACADDSLRRDSGSETVYCHVCGFTYTWEDHHRRLAMLTEQHGKVR
jgi:hypothetical protein